jgi:hypothetical protein
MHEKYMDDVPPFAFQAQNMLGPPELNEKQYTDLVGTNAPACQSKGNALDVDSSNSDMLDRFDIELLKESAQSTSCHSPGMGAATNVGDDFLDTLASVSENDRAHRAYQPWYDGTAGHLLGYGQHQYGLIRPPTSAQQRHVHSQTPLLLTTQTRSEPMDRPFTGLSRPHLLY